jgi:hypothetical protein
MIEFTKIKNESQNQIINEYNYLKTLDYIPVILLITSFNDPINVSKYFRNIHDDIKFEVTKEYQKVYNIITKLKSDEYYFNSYFLNIKYNKCNSKSDDNAKIT